MNKKKISGLIICTLLVGTLLGGCTRDGQKTNDKIMETTQSYTIEEAPEATVQQTDIIISTQYGDLHYPEQWKEFIRTEQEEKEDVVIVVFKADINGMTYPLFEVSIGSVDGKPVGQITDAAGNSRNVSVQVDEVLEDPALTEGEQNRLYAMQEDINYVIENLK